MRIGILTFSSAINYGAVLQAYGLSRVLAAMGHDVNVVEYNPDYLRSAYDVTRNRPGYSSLLKLHEWHFWMDYMRSCCRRFCRKNRFGKFCDIYLSVDRMGFDDVASRYDVLVYGSDQIWNPVITGGRIDDLFFGWLPGGQAVKAVAYAASAGGLSNLNGYETQFAECISRFSAISCREKILSDYINRLDPRFGAHTVADPTLLAGIEVFDEITANRLIKKPYLFYFDIFNDAEIRRRAKTVAERMGLRFVEMSTYHDVVRGQRLFRPGGPDEFLSLVKHSEMVVTTSFHATVFAVMFHKEFMTMEFSIEKSVRTTDLLGLLGLLNRHVPRRMEAAIAPEKPVDWVAVEQKLSAMQMDSLRFLRESLA